MDQRNAGVPSGGVVSLFFRLFAFQIGTASLLLLELFKLMRPADFLWMADYPGLAEFQNWMLCFGFFFLVLFTNAPDFGSRLFLLWTPLLWVFIGLLNSCAWTWFSFALLVQAGLGLVLLLHFQETLASKSRIIGIVFACLNFLALAYLYIDGHYYSITKSHMGMMQLWHLKFAGMRDVAGLSVESTTKIWSRIVAYLLLSLPLISSSFPQPRRPRRTWPVVTGTALCLVITPFHFDLVASRQPIEEYLMLRTEVGGFPIPIPSRLKTPAMAEALKPTLLPSLEETVPLATFSWREPGARRNLVVLTVESWRKDMFDAITQRTRRLASSGIILENHFSQSNLSVTAFFSLFYGFLPVHFRDFYEKSPPAPFFRFLEGSGYTLTRIVSDWDAVLDPIYRGFSTRFLDPKNRYDGTPMVLKGVLEELERPGSHFISATLFHTHFNYYYPPEFELFKPAFPVDRNLFLFFEPTPEVINQIRNRYRNAQLFLDILLEQFFAIAREKGLNRNTVFVVLGDHGESLGECGFMAHATGPHESQFRVGAFIVGPGVNPMRIAGMSRHIDVIPTLAPIMGFACGGLPGRNVCSSTVDFVLNRDDSSEDRLLLRRPDTISLFDVDGRGNMTWTVTTTPGFILDDKLRSWYEPQNHASLAARIMEDRKAVTEALRIRPE